MIDGLDRIDFAFTADRETTVITPPDEHPDIHFMALWIQNRPAEKCSLSELQVAEHLATLSDDWIIRWGYYDADNDGVSRAGDFLILGPRGGLLVLEASRGRQAVEQRGSSRILGF